jgi:nucleotide-binding universal stress UspA family protein
MTKIVVGMDESPHAATALRWAVREQGFRGGSVTAVLAWTYLGQHHGAQPDHFRADYTERDAAAVLDQLVVAALGPDDAARVEREVVCDLAAPGLLTAAKDADLLVLGARGMGGFTGLLLGSVSQQCAHHTTVPLAVVRETPADDRPEHVVVGVDGSPGSQLALEWAAAAAIARSAPLTVVNAWHTVVVPPIGTSLFLDDGLVESDARTIVADQLAQLPPELRPADLRTVVARGSAAGLLLHTADERDATMLVVGTRGRGGFTGLLLGSVSQHVLHHASRPVVMVPAA